MNAWYKYEMIMRNALCLAINYRKHRRKMSAHASALLNFTLRTNCERGVEVF